MASGVPQPLCLPSITKPSQLAPDCFLVCSGRQPGAPWGQEDGGQPLSPLTPWLTSGSRFSGGSVKGTLHTWPFCCAGVSGLQGGGRRAGVTRGAAMGMVLPGPCLGRQRSAFISLNMISSVTRNNLKHAYKPHGEQTPTRRHRDERVSSSPRL